MVALYVNSRIVCGFFLGWLGGPPQSFERSIWDCVGLYTIHTFLDPLVESKFRIISKSYNFLFGTTTTTPSITFSNILFFSGQSQHASSPSIILYLWLGARRPTAAGCCGKPWLLPCPPPLQMLWCCCRRIILCTVQENFWRTRQGQTLYMWGGQTIKAGFPKRRGKDSLRHCRNAGLLVLMQDWAFLRRCSVLDIRFFHGMSMEPLS